MSPPIQDHFKWPENLWDDIIDFIFGDWVWCQVQLILFYLHSIDVACVVVPYQFGRLLNWKKHLHYWLCFTRMLHHKLKVLVINFLNVNVVWILLRPSTIFFSVETDDFLFQTGGWCHYRIKRGHLFVGKIVLNSILVHYITKLLLTLNKLCYVFDYNEGKIFVTLDVINLLKLKLKIPDQVLFILTRSTWVLMVIIFIVLESCLRGVWIVNTLIDLNFLTLVMKMELRLWFTTLVGFTFTYFDDFLLQVHKVAWFPSSWLDHFICFTV